MNERLCLGLYLLGFSLREACPARLQPGQGTNPASTKPLREKQGLSPQPTPATARGTSSLSVTPRGVPMPRQEKTGPLPRALGHVAQHRHTQAHPSTAALLPPLLSRLKDTLPRRRLPPALTATESGTASASGRPPRRIASPIAAASTPTPAPSAPVGSAAETELVQSIVAALPKREPGARVGVRPRRHPRRRYGRRMGAERVLGSVSAVTVHVAHVRRRLMPRTGEGSAGGDVPAEARGRPAS